MKNFIISIVCIFVICFCLYNLYETLQTRRLKYMEYAYFEGQRDALNGDIRIEKKENGYYRWTKTCWDSGRKPMLVIEELQIMEGL